MSSFNLSIHSRGPAKTATSTAKHDNIPFANHLDGSQQSQLARTTEHYRDVIAERDEIINGLYAKDLSKSERIIELTKENDRLRTKLDRMRDELVKIRSNNDSDGDDNKRKLRKKCAPVLRGKARVIDASRRNKQLALDAKREKERVGLRREEGAGGEDLDRGMSGLDVGEVDGVEIDMDLSRHDERSLSLE